MKTMEWSMRTKPGPRGLLSPYLMLFSICLCPTAWAGGFQNPESAASPDGDAAARTARITALGRLEPRGEVIQVAAPLGDRVSQIMASEGELKGVNSVLAYLESHAERLKERDLAAARLEEAKRRLKAETALGEALIREAEVYLEQVQTLEPLEIEAQQANVEGLEAELASAQQDLERLENLTSNNSAAAQELDHQRLLVERSQARLKNARTGLAQLEKRHQVDLAMAQARLESAGAGLSRVRSSIEVESLARVLDLAQERLDRAILRAPVSGQVLRVLAHPGETTGNRAVLLMGDTSQMYAVAEVYETDIEQVREGQKARVSSPALAQELTGTVEEIGQLVSRNEILDLDPAADADRRVVRVKVRLDQSEPAARLVHLQVTVEIEVP